MCCTMSHNVQHKKEVVTMSAKDTTYGVRLDDDLMEKVKQRADQESRTRASLIRHAVRWYLTSVKICMPEGRNAEERP